MLLLPLLKPAIDHRDDPDAIPLPASMIHDLSRIMGQDSTGVFLKLYSAFPFPNRADRKLDSFMQSAVEALTRNPKQIFTRVATIDGKPFVRVAIADPMVKQACVDCHNSHPQSPKRDWKIGDVRGGIFANDEVLRHVFTVSLTVAPRIDRTLKEPEEAGRRKGVIR